MKTIGSLLAVLLLSGCASLGETFSKQNTADIGNYAQPPQGLERKNVGILDFKDKTGSGLEALCSDQISTLAGKTGRFRIIERSQLDNLLSEQGLRGVVRAGEMPRAGQIRGVDYMFLGAVTNFEVKRGSTGLSIPTPLGGLSLSNAQLVVDVGVDLRLVHVQTGEQVASEFGEIRRTQSANAWGLSIVGIGSSRARSEVTLDRGNQGLLLRRALDDALGKMLDKVDAHIMEGTDLGAIEKGLCFHCGAKIVEGAKFCTTCGKSTVTKCKACDLEVKPGAKFCPKCGGPISVGTGSPPRDCKDLAEVPNGNNLDMVHFLNVRMAVK